MLLLFTPGPSRSLVMCYFVYKVITNKVFKKVTCQLLGWWIPFPQWKHASAEASNFLSCTPPKLQCRDCLVINRACTVPSLCMRLGSRERVRGGGRNSLQCTRLQASFSVFIGMVTVPRSSYTLLTRELLVFLLPLFFFPAATSIKSEDRFIMQVYNLGCGVVNFLIVGICQSTGPQYRPPQERVKTLVDWPFSQSYKKTILKLYRTPVQLLSSARLLKTIWY